MSVSLLSKDADDSTVGKNILVAEDSPVTQDLLKLLLTQRGHKVDFAADGIEAANRLENSQYDIALLDFHLPGMNGAQVASKFRNSGKAEKTRIVAITADFEGLLADRDHCESFDEFLPKPLDMRDVCELVESDMTPRENSDQQPARRDIKALFAGAGVTGGDTASSRTKTKSDFGDDYLHWPEDFTGGQLSPEAMKAVAGSEQIKGIIVNTISRGADLSLLWQKRYLHLLPIIDLTGGLGNVADLDASKVSGADLSMARRQTESFRERRVQIHPDLQRTNNLGEKLIGRIFVSGGELKAHHSPDQKNLTGYNVVMLNDAVMGEAEKLASRGLLERVFFDRVHLCVDCGSSRFNIREECAACRSPNLVEESYMHHFRCAHQAPESDFHRGDKLVCPKCSYELTHFSVDYDRPGSVLHCAACGNHSSDASIGFQCLDCGKHSDSQAIPTKDVYSYKLTDLGVAFIENGQDFDGNVGGTFRFTDLPLELMVALNVAAKTFNEKGEPFALAEISYSKETDIVREHGSRHFTQSRNLFAENMRNLLKANQPVVRGRTRDFVLMRGVDPADATGRLGPLKDNAVSSISVDLGVTIKTFGPKDFI